MKNSLKTSRANKTKRLSQSEHEFRLKLATLAIAACFSPLALANPVGPTVVNGAATISNVGNTMTVTNTPGAILNWQQFNIGQGQTTQFVQQSAQSSVLNRVTGPDPSQILGTLKSNGQVFLINPAGIMFGAGSVVDVNGLIASTLNITNADFLANNLKFNGNNGTSVVNQGQITTPFGGSVYLIGNNVTNEGVITTPQGDVVLAAGSSVSMVNTVTPHVSVTVNAPSGGQAMNLGQITAQGGSINIYATLIKQQGLLKADSATVNAQGQIVLSATQSVDLAAGSVTSANGAGNGGTVTIDSGLAGTTTVSGQVSATGATGSGGTVEILGNNVGLFAGANVDVSGNSGGGTVLVGGNFHGTGPQHNASKVIVAKGASINADAVNTGNGGNVAVWSDVYTQFLGNISARGGALSGNGGFVETSGKQTLAFAGLVDTRASNGLSGTLLLDPTDITINAVGPTTALNTAGTFADAVNVASTILNTDLVTQLGLSNVIIDTTSGLAGVGNIAVNAAINWNSAFGLTLNATGLGTIVSNAAGTITNTGLGGVTMNTAGGAITLGGAINLAGGAFAANVTGAGAININAALSTGAGLGSVNLTTTSGAINESATGSITTGGLIGNALGGMSLAGNNSVTTLNAQSAGVPGAGMLSLSAGTTTVSGGLTANSLSISGGTLSLNGVTPSSITNLTLSGGTLGGTGALNVGGIGLPGTMLWTGGTLAGAGVLTLTGTMNAPGLAATPVGLTNLYLNKPLVNAATSTANFGSGFANGHVRVNVGAGGSATNNAGAILSFNNADPFDVGGGGAFTNAGTLYVGPVVQPTATPIFPLAGGGGGGGGGGTSNITFVNNGGTVYLAQNVAFTGPVTLNGGSIIGATLFGATPVTLSNSAQLDFTGALTIAGSATPLLLDNIWFTAYGATTQGTLGGLAGAVTLVNSNLTNQGSWTMNSASFSVGVGPNPLAGFYNRQGSVTVTTGGAATFNAGVSFMNAGTLTATGATLAIATAVNAGVMDLVATPITGHLINDGTLNVLFGQTATIMGDVVNNALGIININGTANFNRALFNNGTINLNSGTINLPFGGSVVNLGTGIFNVTGTALAPSVFNGNGVNQVGGYLPGFSTQDLINAATLNINGVFNVNGVFTQYGGGSINGTLGAAGSATDVLNIATTGIEFYRGASTLSNVTLNVNAAGRALMYPTATLTMQNGAKVNNAGVWDMYDGTAVNAGPGAASLFSNTGVIDLTSVNLSLLTPIGITPAELAAIGTPHVFGAPLNNNGTLNINGGTLTLTGAYTGAVGSVLNNHGVLDINGGTLSLSGTYADMVGSTLNNNGMLSINAGTMTVNGSYTNTVTSVLNVAAGATFSRVAGLTNIGTLSGSGTINVGTGVAGLINKGTINPGGMGAAGTLNITGDLQLDPTSILNFELGGMGTGQSDKLTVTGNVIKGGRLNATFLPGYIPMIADTYSIMTMGGLSSGAFSSTSMQCSVGVFTGYCFTPYDNFVAGESVRLVYDLRPVIPPTIPPTGSAVISFPAAAGNYSGTIYTTAGVVNGTWTTSVSASGLITVTGGGSGTGQLLPDGTFFDMLVTYANGAGSGKFSGRVDPVTGTIHGSWFDLGPPYLSGTFSGSRVPLQDPATQTCVLNPVLCNSQTTGTNSTTTATTTTGTSPVIDANATGNITYSAMPVAVAAPIVFTYSDVRQARNEARRADDVAERAENLIGLARTPEARSEARHHAKSKQAEADAKRAEAKIREAETELQAAEAEVNSDSTSEGRMRAESRKTVAEAKRAEGERDKAEAEAKQAEAEINLAKTPAAKAAAEAKLAEAEARKTDAELKKADVEVRKAETELRKAEAEAKVSNTPEAKARVETKRAEAESKKVEAEIKKAEVEVKTAKDPVSKAAAESKLARAEAKNAEVEAKKADVEAKLAEAEASKSDSTVVKQVAEAKKAEAEAKKAEAEIKSAKAEAKSSNDPEVKAKAEVKAAEAGAKKADAEAKKAEAEVKVAEAKAENSGKAEDKAEVEVKKAEVAVKKAEAKVKEADAEVKSSRSGKERESAELKHSDAEMQKAEAEYKEAELEAKRDRDEARSPQSAYLRRAVDKKSEASEAKVELKKTEFEVKKLVAEAKRAEVEMKQAEVALKEAPTPEARVEAERRFEAKRAEVENKLGEAQAKEQRIAALKANAESKETEFKDTKRSSDSKIVEVFGGMSLASTAKERVQAAMEARHEFMKEKLAPALNILKADPHAADLKPCGAFSGDVCMRPVNPVLLNPTVDVMPKVQLPILTPTTAFLPSIQRKVAVVIGNNAYHDPNIPSLNGAIKDADAIGKVFKEKMGYEVRMVHNGTRADIVRTLNQISDETGSRDSVVIYYAGHGYQMEDTKVGYWIPSDATTSNPSNWISNSDINKMLTNIPAKQMILMSDSCYSGALTSEQKVTAGSTAGESVQDILGKRSVLVMSSGGEEPVLDEGKEGHSIFAWHLMDRLNNVDKYKNGYDVFGAVKSALASENIPQTPQYGASLSAGHTEGGEYLFEVRQY